MTAPTHMHDSLTKLQHVMKIPDNSGLPGFLNQRPLRYKAKECHILCCGSEQLKLRQLVIQRFVGSFNNVTRNNMQFTLN